MPVSPVGQSPVKPVSRHRPTRVDPPSGLQQATVAPSHVVPPASPGPHAPPRVPGATQPAVSAQLKPCAVVPPQQISFGPPDEAGQQGVPFGQHPMPQTNDVWGQTGPAVVVVVVVVVGAGVVVVVVGEVTVPEHWPAGTQRLLPLDQTQQTQPALQTPGLLAQTTLPQVACETCASEDLRTPRAASSPAAAPLTAVRREIPSR